MPKKNTLPSETLQILESLWAQGMQNCSTNENKLKIQQASLATGLVDERIKCWIYSRNRKKRKDDDGGQSKENKSFSTSTKTETCTEDITNSVFEKMTQDETEEVDSEFSRLAQGEAYQDSSSSDEESQQGAAAQLIRGIEGKVRELQACDCDVIVMVYNHNSRYLSTTGTPRALDFLRSQDPGIDFQFAAALSTSS
ncbi:PRELI domain containing protein 3B isoform X1 [Mugil cephalus]|uniref:PRELI domain containing protein 3B isoform X1 n=1 Tax=Mugil cephalus TaxID=48193 RepID=UPI001FB85397|nr:PRELI domain containing protein 3B isoform X1 [Mugil cephalus]